MSDNERVLQDLRDTITYWKEKCAVQDRKCIDNMELREKAERALKDHKTRQGDISAALHAAEVAEKDLRDYKEAEAVRHNARESYDNGYQHGRDAEVELAVNARYNTGVRDGLEKARNALDTLLSG